MKWFLVRLSGGEAEGFPTREMANDMRDRLAAMWKKNGYRAKPQQTVEVIPIRAIREIINEWNKMIKTNEFEGGPLSEGELAIMRSMRQDLLERLDAQ